ncbi:MAG TPA: 2,3-bisphosphoglycerate-independent phosphoglycerate mutase [Thermoleophilaceae bacterium]|nr:2,3-bisphosphoglycerate-independent phosphoglycerate mutase [Thermoleophilaceae bacterium]
MSVDRVCLIVLDGWGLADPGPGNAVEQADTPVFDDLWERWPHTTLTAWGRDVGLPEGQMGNSEVGHLNLGAGAVVRQDLTRIDDAIEDGSFFENEALKEACQSERLHLLGLVSKGGVHASMDHLKALTELAAREGVEDVVLHAFTDGRDTAPESGAGYVGEAEEWRLRVASVSGRYYAMDRDKRWERTQLAFDAIVKGESEQEHADSGKAAVEAAYERDETDEFIKPTLVGDEGKLREGDSVIFFNFRPDRARQLSQKIGDELDVRLTTLTEYSDDFDFPVAFPPARPDTTLAKTLAEAGVEQLHVAETEKYAHVTYFLNGGEEEPYEGEKRELVDSPRDVDTYDEKPEMSAREAAKAFVDTWKGGDFGFGIINFANPDMVGHTGDIEAAVKACETVDECLGQVVEAVEESGGACVITADHGNADDMLEDDGSPQTAHSMNPVPLIVTADVGELREGVLADVAPTILALLGRDQPEAMTGTPLQKT